MDIWKTFTDNICCFFITALFLGIFCCALPEIKAADSELKLNTGLDRSYMQHSRRLYDGVTAYIVNEEGKDFTVSIDVRDINIFEAGPRELLFKVYDPEGNVHVRKVIPDDGVTGQHYQPRFAGWDHEMWYYGLNWARGSVPMLRWSAYSEPGRLGNVPVRTFERAIDNARPGVYRVMVVGARDHYVTLRLDPDLPSGICGHPQWLHGHGDQFSESYIYVPRGTTGMNLGFAEFDQPQGHRFRLSGPDGEEFFDGKARGGFVRAAVEFDEPGQYDDRLLKLEVSEGENDFLLHVMLYNKNAGNRTVAAVMAPDHDTAEAIRGGAIYHDGNVFWHMFQVRLHEWLEAMDPEDFVVRDEEGNIIEPVELDPRQERDFSRGLYSASARGKNLEGLPKREGFLPLAGPHETPPLCDRIMHHYPAHRNREALNLAIKNLAEGLSEIATGDHRGARGWRGNMAFEFSPFRWQYWRAAWRILQDSDAPQEVKDILREAFILCGDRLAFCRGIERVLGNAFIQIPVGLLYSSAATEDPMQRELYEVYLERFNTEGWGEGTGVSRSGTLQEHFAHGYHYGAYAMEKLAAPLSNFDEPVLREIRDRLINFYSYVWAPEVVPNMWSSRTAHKMGAHTDFTWKGEGGPDFTRSVNDGDEWFAARRSGYYIVTFHGRLAPMWLNNYFDSRLGYGGGAVVQMSVPGQGPVIVSTLNGHYGAEMEPANWQNFRIHSVVGEMADGSPLVTADSEHLNAELEDNIVSSSGEVRDCPVYTQRRYEFLDDGVEVELALKQSIYHDVMWGMGRNSRVREAYEMIPYVSSEIKAVAENGETEMLTAEDTVKTSEVRIDRGGFGVDVMFDSPRKVRLGANHTLLVELVERTDTNDTVEADNIGLKYRLMPFVKD